ncbi:hypothetical protein BOW53_07560 [Solemya pervernicosa gill symbiont]|uniref:Lipase maturation factor 2 n=1 Tax=Solemya pervernicosa gill symbiont TaxID=642797 RepID=A0A1T2L5W7_9GAMM|nr:lipase maturation factor family protein [Solemya pervernicosa gill symbiont]OOZ40497.1 hypothetical protein BOW53_07560 [Solemya pervernicosa gill symbiont]
MIVNPRYLFEYDEGYQLTGWLFLRLLALIYASAFVSLTVQIEGLVGPSGILPMGEFLNFQFIRQGGLAWLSTPTLFWLDSSDTALFAATIAGFIFSMLLLFGLYERLSLILLFILYLSLYHAGQVFMNFQWDVLLLETGFLAIFLTKGVNGLSLLLFHLLLFRLRFLSGLSKIISEDPTWANLTTLQYYFETQPLPHFGSWFAHQLPHWLHVGGTAGVLIAELLIPFFIFLPRRFRITAAVVTIIVQLIIIATSNHNFVNLLTILLCLFLLDDRIIERIMPSRLRNHIFRQTEVARPTIPGRLIQGVTGGAIIVVSISMALKLFGGVTLNPQLQQFSQLGSRYGVGHVFHIFPNMQTERHELQIEGSYDGTDWQPYIFNYKPQVLDEKPAIHIPHDPRLDWMIWFVPPQNPQMTGWFHRFMWQLSKNEPKVTALLRENPFEGRAAPRYLRVLVYRYHFTDWQTKNVTGEWWQRKYLGEFPNVVPRSP